MMTRALRTIGRCALATAAVVVAIACACAQKPDAGVLEDAPAAEPPPRITMPADAAPADEPAAADDVAVPMEGEQPPVLQEAPAEEDWRGAAAEDDILVDADEVYYQSGATIAEGNVIVRYRNITVTSDTAEIDEDGVWGQFRGNVTIQRDEQVVTAELIRLNFETEEWEVLGAQTVFQPEQFETGVEEPIYVRAETVAGTGEEERLDAYDGLVTSCDLVEPHYGLHSRHLRVIGEERVVLENPRLEILGNTIFRLPFDLVLSQQSRNNRFFPELGQNSVEGFFAKFAYLYLTGGDLNSYVRLHLSEKRGIGLGGDHYFRVGPHSGEASVFYEPDQGSLSGRVRHEWQVTPELDSRLNVSLQQNSGYATASKSLTGNLSLTHRGEMSNTTFGIDHSLTDTSFTSSRRFTSTLNHRQRMPGDASWDLRATMRRSEFGGATPVSEIIDGIFQYQDRGGWYDWALAAEKQWETEGTGIQGFRLERLPEVVFNTDSQRLGDYELFGVVPFRARVIAGHFVQYPDEDEIATAALDLDMGGVEAQLTDNTTLTSTMNFYQGFYSDDSALYTVSGSLDINTEFSESLFSRVSHRAATVAGFSPLRRDYAGVYDYTTFSLVHQRPEQSRFELTGGFDYVQDQWRELRLRGWFNASERDRLEIVSGFSLDDSIWRPVQLRWTHATPWKLYLALSSTYDLDEGNLDSADLEFDWRIDDRWQFAGLTTYSGYQGDLQDLSLRLTRDLHCWLATLSYDTDYDELRLNLGIKAFPFEAQDWTVGRGGARQGSFQQYYY
jgi:hypothetical protein